MYVGGVAILAAAGAGIFYMKSKQNSEMEGGEKESRKIFK
jgi:hypothetical protein